MSYSGIPQGKYKKRGLVVLDMKDIEIKEGGVINPLKNQDKVMENKYYTPSIEEFHVGFEYEYNSNRVWLHELTNGKWFKQTFDFCTTLDGDSIPSEVNSMLDRGEIRVKYLNQSDMDSLGFEFMKSENEIFETYLLRGDHYDTSILKSPKDFIMVSRAKDLEDSDFKGSVIFNGKIKNKSELKRLLKQLGI